MRYFRIQNNLLLLKPNESAGFYTVLFVLVLFSKLIQIMARAVNLQTV